MKSLWNDAELKRWGLDDLSQRVYSSRVLGSESSLVLHGGGNTSVKSVVKNPYGENEEILFVKGSGWDLATIEREGFSPVRMDALLKMAKMNKLDDQTMVKLQRAAMLDPYAPNPSVEAILHAIIPYKFVDHTHADAVVTLTNTPKGKGIIKDVYGESMIIVPYVMPGFILAREIYQMTKDLDWSKYKGMILMHHGVFTFDDHAKTSYEKMIKAVSKAEKYLKENTKGSGVKKKPRELTALTLSQMRKEISQLRKKPVLVQLDKSKSQQEFASRTDVSKISQRGPLTPDHIIRTKRVPIVFTENIKADVQGFQNKYAQYFKEFGNRQLKCLDAAPRWGIVPGVGTLSFGCSIKENKIITDILAHTTQAIVSAEKLGGWKALGQKDLFEMEYWVLEQAKLAKAGVAKEFQGRVVLVTGAASGIGKAAVEHFVKQGAVVGALDCDPKIKKMFDYSEVLGIQVDVTNEKALMKSIEQLVFHFGGIDIVVSNAGTFPPSKSIEKMNQDTWNKSVDINLTSHQLLIKHCTPYLEYGMDANIVIMGSKNVPAPGPGVSAYSVAKAGLTQLGRVAALELAAKGIRVNMIHPNAVFDTAIWTDDILKKRAKNYNMTVAEYKTNNLLKKEITSNDVAELVSTVAGATFKNTTGAQIPIDGGNDRVI